MNRQTFQFQIATTYCVCVMQPYFFCINCLPTAYFSRFTGCNFLVLGAVDLSIAKVGFEIMRVPKFVSIAASS